MKLLHVVMGTAVLWGLVGQAFVVRAEPGEIEFHGHEEAEQNRLIDKPTLNSSPQRLVVIKGHKDSNLELWFELSYTTQAKQCQTQTLAGRVMGAPDTSQEVIDWLRVPAGQTEYSVRFFLDRYLPGRCNWRSLALFRTVFDAAQGARPDGKSTIVVFRPDGRQSTEVTWVCRRKPTQESRGKEAWLTCSTVGPFSPETTIMSDEGGQVEANFTFAPD
ncbi:hypothetical protein [Paraburkholderia sacchari]|uniref:Uncharacterized protein n=1 Tax=Paraburkholderia sacchari TaxID=159450 RepID=A0A8T6ZHD9_9BURK|nr:hypothetical protein [Paraburkholderia sacchari]NLP64637.1 hypothetical protein [Paraburkholderia sacchari]